MQVRALDREVFDLLTTRPSPRLDAVLYPLSRAADHSLLWIACAGVIGTRRNRFARRAAGRGLLALGITSAVCNAVLKPIFQRARPTYVRSSLLARVARVPGSTSFPSGHSASAFAFAVGAGMELPTSAVPLGALAAAVAFSRVRTRVHYPGDVIAGAALGAVVALGTRTLWPVAPHEPAVAPHAFNPVDGVALANGDGLAIVVNSSAGPDDSDEMTRDIRADLPDATLIAVGGDVQFESALGLAAEAAVVGIVGGDGSVNGAAEQALAARRPLAVFPGGTLNHFARDIGLRGATDTIQALKDGELIAIDVGIIDGKPFLNTASLGNYAEFVDTRERLERGLGKWAAMVVATARMLWRAEPAPLEINGKQCKVWMIFIGNCEYQPTGLAPTWRERLDDGLLDLRYVGGTAPWSRARVLGALAIGQLPRAKAYTRLLTESIEIRSLNGPLRLARDGETFDGGNCVRINKYPERLAVYAPHQQKGVDS